jgi:pyruvate dehydrogenase E1 component beta subunit
MESVYARIPGLVVVAPSTPFQAKGLLKTSIRCDDPVIFLESEKILNEVGEVPDGEFLLPIGKANVEREGKDVTVISYGRPMQRVVRTAVQALVDTHGIDVELIDLQTLRPLDLDTILKSIKKTNRCVIVDEDWGYCGMGAGILYRIQKPAFDDLDAPIEYIHCDEIPVPFSHPLEEAMLPSVDRIVAGVKEVTYK